MAVTVFLGLGTLPLLAGPASAATTVYQNDFSSGAGNEWSPATTDTTPSGETYLGHFSSTATTLTLTGLPLHKNVSVSFSLYVIGTWDGNAEGGFLPVDQWYVRDDSPGAGNELLRTTFSNCPDSTQAYPSSYPGGTFPYGTGASQLNALGYPANGCTNHVGNGDATYAITLTFSHTSPSLVLTFAGAGPDITEWWGIDDITVTVSNSPSPNLKISTGPGCTVTVYDDKNDDGAPGSNEVIVSTAPECAARTLAGIGPHDVYGSVRGTYRGQEAENDALGPLRALGPGDAQRL